MASNPLGISQVLDWPQVFQARWAQTPFFNRSFSPPPPKPFSLSDFPFARSGRWIPAEPVPQTSPALYAGLLLPPLPVGNPTDWYTIFRPRWAPATEPPPSKVLQGYPLPVSPFNLGDWFTSYRPRWVPGEPVPQNSLLAGIPRPVPFSQSDWFYSRQGRWIPAEPVFQNYLPRGIPTPFPNRQLDWFNYYRQPWVTAEPVYQSPVLAGIPSVPPFYQTDWPQVKSRPWNATATDTQNATLFGIPPVILGPFGSTQNPPLPRPRWIPFDDFPNTTFRLPVTPFPFSLKDWPLSVRARGLPDVSDPQNLIASGLTNPVIGFYGANIVNQVIRPRFINEFTSDIGQNSLTLNVYNPILGRLSPPNFSRVWTQYKVAPDADLTDNSLALSNTLPGVPNIPYPDFASSVAWQSKFISENWVLPNYLALTTPQATPFSAFPEFYSNYSKWTPDTTPQNILASSLTIQPNPFAQLDWHRTARPQWIEKDDSDFPNLIITSVFVSPFSYDDSCWPSVQRPRWVQSLDYFASATLLFNFPARPFHQDDWTPAQKWRHNPLQNQDVAQSFIALTTAAIIPFGLFDYPTLPTYRSAQQAPVILNPIIYGIPAGLAPFFHGQDFFPQTPRFRFVPSIDTQYPYSFLTAIGYVSGGPGHAIIELPRRRRQYTTRAQRFKRRKDLDEWAQGIRDLPKDFRS